MATKKVALEVSSQSLHDELTAIKDRLSAIETIQSISNAAIVRKYVELYLQSKWSKAIMKECETPQSRAYLVSALGLNSPQALDHHLRPLRESGLLRQRASEDGTVVLEWSNLFRSLSKATHKTILADSQP